MGHDITANVPGIDRDGLQKKYRIDDYDAEWPDRYDLYCQESEVAYCRRGAFNPLNQVLYLSLGVYDEAYDGCSGTGITLAISKEQFLSAMACLECKTFEGMERPRNAADECIQGLDIIQIHNSGDSGDVTQEMNFLYLCWCYCDQHNLESLEVSFR